MRILLVTVTAIVLAGCSDRASDLTKEQKAALQMLGERTSDAGHERWQAAHKTVYEREQVYVDIMNASKPGTAEHQEASAKGWRFMKATNNLALEYYRRKKADGSEKAADWYVAEIKKSDDQIIEDWHTD